MHLLSSASAHFNRHRGMHTPAHIGHTVRAVPRKRSRAYVIDPSGAKLQRGVVPPPGEARGVS
eukprot:1701636-Pleurochrysis_carterae.AAC.3